jgi:HlyD family secretion protein
MKRALIVLLVIAAIGGGGAAYYIRQGKVEPTVNTSPVTRGDVIDTVGATGTLQAVTTVQVGSQVSGNISSLGADFNSIVKKDQVVARLDPSLFEAQMQQARANLTQTRANLTKAQSDLERTKVQLQDAQQKYARAKELAAKSLLPLSELDAAKIAVDSAQASLQSQQATVVQAQAAVTQSEASVNQNQVNLDHTVILAPIDGIVIQRSVDVGQTVAASMSAPTLFIIAADLTKMQVNASIDESDVGRIRPGQTVTFRVDAYPGQQFEGSVGQVRLQPKVVQNVTTYETIINVPNPELKLKPGMTANLRVQIARRTDVVRVPNVALRFRPTADIFAALNQEPPPNFAGGGRGGRGGRGRDGGQADTLPAPIVNAGQPARGQAAPVTATAPGSVAPPTQPAAGATTGGDGGERRRGNRGGGGFNADRSGTFAGGGGDASGGRGGFGGRGGDGAGGGRGGFGGGFGRGGGDGGGDRTARLLERFKAMSPDEQKQFIARMKERGQDVSALEAQVSKGGAKTTASSGGKGKKAAPEAAQTIDALFAPLPTVETAGNAWLYVDKQLKRVNLRLGITDGTQTEVISGELQPGMDVVTGVIVGNVRQTTPQGNAGNPLLPNQGNRGGFPGGGRGRG